MASLLTTLADAVVTSLNAAALGFTATRKYVPRWERTELATLRVTVVPLGGTEAMASRRAIQEDFLVDVAVQKAIDPTAENTDCDTLTELTEAIKAHLRFTTFSGYCWIGTENVSNAPFWSSQHLQELHVFTSAARYTFRKVRTP